MNILSDSGASSPVSNFAVSIDNKELLVIFKKLPVLFVSTPHFQTVKTVDIELLITFFHSIGVEFPKVSCGIL